MPIVSSVLAGDLPEIDGRRRITELHTDQLGVVHTVDYLAEADTNAAASMAARVAVLDAQLQQHEIAANMAAIQANGRQAAVTFNHATAGQNRTALRQAYAQATRVEAIMIADYLASLTDAQLQVAFSLTAAQVTSLRTTRLTPAVNAATAIRTAAGL